jgi:hypothetical protein
MPVFIQARVVQAAFLCEMAVRRLEQALREGLGRAA